jgi:DNA-directed RNA polymerase subunit RPC12/RpoP
MILYACPTCGAHLEAEDHYAGQKHACPQCGQRLQVPVPSPPHNRTVLGKLLCDPVA